jgi:hypothetical protein
MKKVAIALIILAFGLMMSACNKHSCPAYAQKDTAQTENAG